MPGRHPNAPGLICDRWGRSHLNRSNLQAEMEWWAPQLSGVKGSITNGLSSVSQAGATWTVAVSSGATADVGDGIVYYWDIPNISSGKGMNPSLPFVCWTSVEVTTASFTGGEVPELYLETGLTETGSGLPSETLAVTGIHWDNTNHANIDVLAGILNTGGPGSRSGAQAGVIGYVGVIEVGPGRRIMSAQTHSCQATAPTWKYTKRASSTGIFWDSDDEPVLFLALGRVSAGSGVTETVSFKFHALFAPQPSAWFPT